MLTETPVAAARGAAPAARSAFTLVELLVVTVVFSSLAAVVLGLVLRQQRFRDALLARVDARRAVRDAADALGASLRGIAPAAGDIHFMSASEVDVRAPAGSAVLCAIAGARDVAVVPPRTALGGALTSWIVPPVPGDTVLVLEGAPPDSARWHAHVLASDPGRGVCPVAGGLAGGPADSARAIALPLAPPLESEVAAGAALRVVRTARWMLYIGGTGASMLGASDCLATRTTPCAAVQPVAGPFARTGVRFAFRDSAGEETTRPDAVRRIDVDLRTPPLELPRADGFGRNASDSLTITIAPRN